MTGFLYVLLAIPALCLIWDLSQHERELRRSDRTRALERRLYEARFELTRTRSRALYRELVLQQSLEEARRRLRIKNQIIAALRRQISR